jgi:hypothetical protein
MMKTGTGSYLGITMGRMTPGFVNTMWSPRSRDRRKPSASKTLLNSLNEIGLSFSDMEERKGQGDFSATHKLRTFEFIVIPEKAGFLEDLIERTHLVGFF